MNCETANHYMMRYFDGECNDIEKTKLKHHLKECNECRQIFSELENILGAACELPDIEPPADFEEQVMKKIALLESEKHAEKKTKAAGFLTIIGLLAAGLSAAIIACIVNIGIVSDSVAHASFPDVLEHLAVFVLNFYETVCSLLVKLGFVFVQVSVVLLKTYCDTVALLLMLFLVASKLYETWSRRESGGMR